MHQKHVFSSPQPNRAVVHKIVAVMTQKSSSKSNKNPDFQVYGALQANELMLDFLEETDLQLGLH